MAKAIKRHSYKVIAAALAVSMFVFYFSLVDTSKANQVTLRSDTLSNSNISATSNHTVAFTVQDAITQPGGNSASSNFSVTFPSDFNLGTITCSDIDLTIGGTATSFNTYVNDPRTNCANTTTAWGVNIDSAARIVLFTTPTSAAAYTNAPVGTALVVSIGQNASFQGAGVRTITNATTSGVKQINIGSTSGGFGGTGTIDVFIISAVTLSATVNETLTLTLAGLPGTIAVGQEAASSTSNPSMSYCATTTPASINDFGDGAVLNVVTTTAATVPFGTITNSDSFYQGCIKVSLSSNQGNGYTIRTRETNSLQTGSGLIIPNTACDASGCSLTPSSSKEWATASNNGLGISCENTATSQSCSQSSPIFGGNNGSVTSGKFWAPIASEGSINPTNGNQTPAAFSSLSGATSVEVITKAKFRLSVSGGQAAGTYTNLVSFIATPTF